MSMEVSLDDIKKKWHGTIKSYIIGFLLSIFLTGVSFLLVSTKALSDQSLVYTIVALALVQAIVQLLFFFHLGQEEKPYWEILAFSFMVAILLIIAVGSLWIMNDLNDRVMSHMTSEVG